MKSLTLFPDGWDKCVMRRNRPVFLGTRPTGEHRRFEIGLCWKGPAILPNWTSCITFSHATSSLCNTDIKFLQETETLGPSYCIRKPVENPSNKNSASTWSGYTDKYWLSLSTLIGVFPKTHKSSLGSRPLTKGPNVAWLPRWAKITKIWPWRPCTSGRISYRETMISSRPVLTIIEPWLNWPLI